METKTRNYYRFTPFTKPIKNHRNLQSTEIRKVIGLPDITDTEKNCVHMHNEFIETESGSINKYIGDVDNRNKEYDQLHEESFGIGSKFGH